METNIMTNPIAMASTAIFIIRAETVLSLLDEVRILRAKKNSKFNRCLLSVSSKIHFY